MRWTLPAWAEGMSTVPPSDDPIVSVVPSPASPAAGACCVRSRKKASPGHVEVARLSQIVVQVIYHPSTTLMRLALVVCDGPPPLQ